MYHSMYLCFLQTVRLSVRPSIFSSPCATTYIPPPCIHIVPSTSYPYLMMSLYSPLSLRPTAYLLNIPCKRRHLGHPFVQQWHITWTVCKLPSCGWLYDIKPLRFAGEIASVSAVTDRLTNCDLEGSFMKTQWRIAQTQQNLFMFIIVLGQHVSI